MLMLAMYALSRSSDPAFAELAGAGRFIDQALMVAADINNGALEAPQGAPPLKGQGSWIAQYSKTVTAYWSTADDRLSYSDKWKEYHNPSFPLRLGLRGLNSYASGEIVPNAYGLDCSLVVNGNSPYTPPSVTVHEILFLYPAGPPRHDTDPQRRVPRQGDQSHQHWQSVVSDDARALANDGVVPATRYTSSERDAG